ANGRMVNDIKGVTWVVVLPILAATAQFIKADDGDGADEGEADGEGIKQREGDRSGAPYGDDDADGGVDEGDEQVVRGVPPEIGGPFRERIDNVADGYRIDMYVSFVGCCKGRVGVGRHADLLVA